MPRRVLRGNCARSIDSDPRKATMPPAANDPKVRFVIDPGFFTRLAYEGV